MPSTPRGRSESGGPGGVLGSSEPPAQGDSVREFTETIALLRERCPWVGALTAEALVPYLREETEELAEAIEDRHPDKELMGELGDVLLQVVLHARLAEERGAFTFADVANTITAKMKRRNPHVFNPDGTPKGAEEPIPSIAEIEAAWNRIKAEELSRDGCT